MIFKTLHNYPIINYQWRIVPVLLMLTSPLYAEVTVNNAENNDKINDAALSIQAAEIQPAGNADRVAGPDTANSSRVWELRAEQWEMTRSGETVLAIPVLNQLVNAWLLDKTRDIELRYPGGEEGEFWVQELTDWMVSLGIPSNQLVSIPGSGSDDAIKFALINGSD